MEALEAVRAELSPRLDALVEHLERTEDWLAASFFAAIAGSLVACDDEPDLLEVFFALSTSAFQGFVLDTAAAARLDDILAVAEQVSRTFAAGKTVVH